MKKREGNFPEMTTREAVLSYGLSLPDTYQDAPFHDENWQLVRVRKIKRYFFGPTNGMEYSAG